ncbi:hypothetical protein A2U01_0073498, partial [Trifolium medium]|nr:hypothetical protein [Trifolium medium]
MVNWWHATLGSSLGISVAFQANKSAFSLKQAFNCFLAKSGSLVPIFTPLVRSSPRGMSSNSPSVMG